MLVDRIRLMDFRGSRDNLTVDLNVPLTVLYAVNGTGKTTLGDALEWLLTGEVRRLADTDPQYCNWFKERGESELLVEADLQIDGTTQTLGRTRAGDLKVLNPFGRWIHRPDSELLRQIMGHEIAAASAIERNKAQKEWIQTAHFFDGQGLDAIVDPTPEGRILRRRAFSSLFGVGARQQQRADLGRLLAKMTPTWLDAGLGEAERALSERQRTLSEDGLQDLAALRLELTDRVVRAEETEGLGASPDPLTTGRVEVIRLRVRERLNTLKQASQAEAMVRERLARVGTQREALSLARSEADAQAALLDSLLAQQPTLEADLVRERGRKVGALASSERIHGASRRLTTIHARLLETMAGWRWSKELPLMPADELATLIATLEKRYVLLRERRETWQQCLSQCATWVRVREEELQLLELVKVAQQRLDSLRARNVVALEISKTQRVLSEIQTELQNVGGVFARFRNEATTLLAGLKDESECPLCGHTYGNQDLLRSAINKRLNTEPAAIASLASRLQLVADNLAQLNLELVAHDAAVVEVKIADARAQEKSAVTIAAIAQLVSLGLPPESIDHPHLAEALSQHLAEAEKFETDENQQLNETILFSNATASLREIAAALTDIQHAINDTEKGDILNHPVGNWESWCGELVALIGQRIDDVIQFENSATESVTIAEKKFNKLKENVEQTVVLRDTSRAEVLRLDEWITEWTNALTQFGLTGDPSVEDVEIKAASIHNAYETSEEWARILTTLLEEVTAFLRRVQGEDEIGRLRSSADAARALARRRQQWSNDLQKAVSALDERQRLDIAAQIGPLRNTIRAIFGRSQAHEVIDQVDVVPRNDGSLDWKVTIGDHEESEMRVLSRGQRQDLALSVFLARAIGIGGTVFMDEPLLHLDDLNRVGLLDTLRVIAQEHGERLRVVMTTADRMLVRHFREKFDLLAASSRQPLLQIITLTGGPREGVRASIEPVARKAIYDEVALFPPASQMP